MSQKHTPGPWEIRIEGTGSGRSPVIVDPNNTCTDGSNVEIAELPTTEVNPRGEGWVTSDDGPEWREEIEANAALIAAAPELLEAAIDFVNKVETGRARSKDSYAKFKAAIKKATP